jgi:thiol-disulfide isomerase/thioredoxin
VRAGLRGVLALASAAAFTACTGAQHGGAGDLPGPVPSGVTFEAPPGGMDAADFSATLLDGTPLNASELWADRPVVLVFTASWCGMCADVHRDLAEVVDGYDDAVALLGVVNEDDEAAALDYAADLRLGHPIAVVDDRVWLLYAAHEPPLVALVAPGGMVLRGWPGGVEPDRLAEHLDGIVQGSGEGA